MGWSEEHTIVSFRCLLAHVCGAALQHKEPKKGSKITSVVAKPDRREEPKLPSKGRESKEDVKIKSGKEKSKDRDPDRDEERRHNKERADRVGTVGDDSGYNTRFMSTPPVLHAHSCMYLFP